MFKRANKLTALLVAAAAVVSLVPATAANASDRLGTKDGTIDNAVAYKDGKYLYEGYRTDDDDQGIYYNSGDKDKLLEDIEDADLMGSYSDKYAFANDGSDQYLVDLTNGDVLDDETPEDDADTAATKLKTQLKKTDRYGEIGSIDGSDIGYVDENTTGALPGNKYGETWYEYSVTPEAGADGENNTYNNKLYGFTNESGKYIDASNVANVYAYSSAKGKVVKIDEFSNDLADVDDDSELLATLVGAPQVLTQDKDYIYALVKVKVTDTHAGAVNDATTADAVGITDDNNKLATSKITEHTYIQKIAKEQGEQKDDAYTPKTVASYELLNDDNKLDNDDSRDANEAITNALASGSVTIVGNQLVAVEVSGSGDNVKATSINLKKDKVEYVSGFDQANLDTDKVDVYLAEKDDDDDVDVDNGAASYDVDVDGNVWVVADGKIYKFQDNEMKQVYTTDSSLDSISVYDEKNLITWEHDGDIYTTVNEGSAETAGEATPAQTGWVNTAAGWTFYDAAGKQVVGSWVNAGGVWYMMKADGVMATGWYNDNGTWYFLNASGAMQTGWTNANGTWYFLKSSGAMATGWLNDNGTWYYLNSNGSMAANTTVDGYTLGASGAWIQ